MTRPIRVAHIAHTTAPGGAEIALMRLLKAHVPWHATLVVPRGSERNTPLFNTQVDCREVVGPLQPPGAINGTPRTVVQTAVRMLHQAVALATNRNLTQVDVIHSNSTRAAAYAALANKVLRKKLIVHLRDLVSPDALGRLGFRIMTRFVLPAADGVIANSSTTLASAEPYMEGAKRQVIPSPIGLERVARVPELVRELKTVGVVARIDEWKGQHLLLEAFARVFGSGTERLIFIGGVDLGGAEYLQSLKARAESLGVLGQVEFVGQVDPSAISGYVDQLDVCVQCSVRPEPLGQNVLQYLARGRPTIVTDTGGPAEWVQHGENGLHFRMGDVGSLAQQLRNISPLDVRTRLASGAASTVVLDDAAVVRQHEEFYRTVLGLP